MKCKFFHFFIAALLLIGSSACDKDSTDNNGGGGKKPVVTPPVDNTQINGTKIDSANDLIGLIKDSKTGQGIAGIPVSDGYSFTVTDANGVYQMKANEKARKVYYTTPADYCIAQDEKTGLPAFYSQGFVDHKKVNRNDFELEPRGGEAKDYALVMIGDPQCQKTEDMFRYRDETVPDVKATIESLMAAGTKEVYAITLGDITFDSSSLWSAMKETMSGVTLSDGSMVPFFQTIGNHDHYAHATDEYYSTENYTRHFGPTDYSFNIGDVHFIVMDNVLTYSTSANSSPDKGTRNYYGGFTQEQYNWLKEDLSYVQDKGSKMVVFCAHIPFRGGASSATGSSVNKDKYHAEVLTLLKDFNEAHLMIGHTHYAQNYIHKNYTTRNGLPIYEHIHGAACGSWWSCDSDVTGGPNGYNVYTVSGNKITNWYTKGTNRDKDFQFRVYDGTQEYTGSKGYRYMWPNGGTGGSKNIKAVGNSAFSDSFVAQVWDDDDTNWKLEFFQKGVKVGDFKRLSDGSSANICYVSYCFNEMGKNTDTWVNKTASHYWYFRPASGKPGQEYNWEVVATQTIPGTDVTNVYKVNRLTRTYDDF